MLKLFALSSSAVVLAVLISGCVVWYSTFDYAPASRYLRQAEQAARQGKTKEAETYYLRHIQFRLDFKERPDWENPYFYHLLIGDLYLKENNIEEALSHYQKARSEGVELGLVADRFRQIASFYESEEKFDQAISFLSEHRELDPLLFDLMRDRIAREMVQIEERSKDPETPRPQ
ncbi:MAG: tetratricopeptide repeat protein [Bdellovibrionales bacterium]|nr:tetratricopeptide repeat protein [Bdellovibrionales bacterium]